MRHYSRSSGGHVRRTRRASAPPAPDHGSGLLLLADPLHIPYPILLVVGGLALGFAPGVPTVTLPPDAVIVGILPPLLYSASFNTGLRDLKRNIRPISLLAIGLVTADDGRRRRRCPLRDRPFVGAADSCSAPSSPRPTRSPRRRSRTDWESRVARSRSSRASLVNDGTALVLFRFAAVAVVSRLVLARPRRRRLRLDRAGWDRGRAPGRTRRSASSASAVDNPPLEVTIAFLTGYIAFLPAAALGRVRSARRRHGRRLHGLAHAGADDRRHDGSRATGSGQIFSFLLNALLFGLVGLQLRPILDQLPRSLLASSCSATPRCSGCRRRRPVRLRLPDRVCAALVVAQPARTRSDAAVAVHHVHRLGRHARRRDAGRARSRSRSRSTPESRSRTAALIVFLAFSIVLRRWSSRGLAACCRSRC